VRYWPGYGADEGENGDNLKRKDDRDVSVPRCAKVAGFAEETAYRGGNGHKAANRELGGHSRLFG
jgi:hypothetical protein